MKPGDVIGFAHRGHAYELELVSLDNALVGDDSASFELRPVPGQRGHEPGEEGVSHVDARARIAALIDHVAALDGAVFIRNGDEHAAADAADHLRRKWAAAGEFQSAEAFIEAVATRSSVSGRPYRIRLADGREVESGPYLLDVLAAQAP
jgi:hypothetical protein